MLDIRQRTGYMLLAVMVGHVILISAQVNAKSGQNMLEAVTFGAFSEIQRGTSSIVRSARWSWAHYLDLRSVRRDNESLKQQLSDLQVRMQQQRAQVERATRLQQLLDLRPVVQLKTVAAQVIASDATPWFRTVTIDRGSDDGVQADMAVIAPIGVVGRVVGKPSAHAAKVQLLIDRNAAAGAMIERSRAAGVVTGVDGDPPLEIEYVSNLADVKPGDTVVTSGMDGIYPKGFVIGRVELAVRGAGIYKTIRVRPVIDFSGVEEVLVVLKPASTPAAQPAQ